MAQTTLLASIDIKPGRTDDFKAAAEAIFARASAEPGTLRYEYFLSEDGTGAMTIEDFAGADAWVFHNRNVADLAPALFDTIRRVSTAVIGDANEALRAEMEGVDTRYYVRLGGVVR